MKFSLSKIKFLLLPLILVNFLELKSDDNSNYNFLDDNQRFESKFIFKKNKIIKR